MRPVGTTKLMSEFKIIYIIKLPIMVPFFGPQTVNVVYMRQLVDIFFRFIKNLENTSSETSLALMAIVLGPNQLVMG